MPIPMEQQVVLFGGQGSQWIFSSNTLAIIEDDTRAFNACSKLLTKCHAAFLREIESLEAHEQAKLDIRISQFTFPLDLLKPEKLSHTHPLLQATTIYLCQTIHYLAEICRSGGTIESSFCKISETTGFCSGLLPALVVAVSQDLDNFTTAAVEAFRITFWVACRNYIWTTKDSAGALTNKTSSPDVTYSLAIRGLSSDQVNDRLTKHVEKQYSKVSSPDDSCHVKISAILNSSTVSVSGPPTQLENFKAEALPDVASTFAYIHGWYHGGDHLKSVVMQILDDLMRRAVFQQSIASSCRHLRSTLDSSLLKPSSLNRSELLKWLLHHMLSYRVEWNSTAHAIAETLETRLSQDSDSTFHILSFGPGPSSLVQEFGTHDARLVVSDLSPFRAAPKDEVPLGIADDIAIVGMSVNLPKGNGPEELWTTLSEGLNAVQEIPESRFKIFDYMEDSTSKSRSMPTKHGGFLEDPFSFDNTFFNVSPREAKSMDPQQRLLLHAAQQAFEDAGYVGDSTPSYQRASTGCYIGLATGDYTDNLRDDIDVFYSPGTLRAFHSGKISYFFKLSGPSVVIDTACSSSMVAIHQACRALQTGDCTSAITGGVNVISSPDMFLGLSRGHFLSSSGGCKPFDEAADGYCRAEGCVLFVLKRLSNAIAENDHIHGIIKSVAVNQAGSAHSITHPHSETQVNLFRNLLDRAKLGPECVSVVEAHGTGTQAGDACEMESLRNVFSRSNPAHEDLTVSSIKGNIGHCEAASGAASLAKLLLMLKKKLIPLQVGFRNINPVFSDLRSSGIIIPKSTTPWPRNRCGPRRAMLNNFGAAGSNAALLLEEWVKPTICEVRSNERSAYIFTLSAKSQVALRISIRQHLDFLNHSKRNYLLRDVCYTACARRQSYDHRLSVVCTSIEDLKTQLDSQISIDPTFVKPPLPIVFVFSGQGAMYKGMGEELLQLCPVFQKSVMECEEILRRMEFPSILGDFRKDSNTDTAGEGEEQVIVSQCACVALEYALAKMFMSWGITPQCLIGHSLGEYVALCISGTLTLEDTIWIVASRARLMTEACTSEASGMLACKLSNSEAESLISQNSNVNGLTVACCNSANDTVIGGPLDQLSEFQKISKDLTVKSKLLDVPYAFHTPAMDPIVEPLQQLRSSVQFKEPTIPTVSTALGRFLETEDLTQEYFANHARQTVRFTEGLAALRSRFDQSVFLEIGPHPTTLPLLRKSIPSSICDFLGSLHKSHSAWNSIAMTLAILSLRKLPIKWREVYSGVAANVVTLPGHPLITSSFVVPYKEPVSSIEISERTSNDGWSRTGFDLLPKLNTEVSTDGHLVLETTLETLAPLILGHKVGGKPLCPASLFHELALEGVHTLLQSPRNQMVIISGLDFVSPLTYASSRHTDIVTVLITKHDGARWIDFKIMSRSINGSIETVHCTGKALQRDFKSEPSSWVKDAAMVKRQSRHFSTNGKDDVNTFKTQILYDAVFSRVVDYSPRYRSLLHLSVAESNLEGIGKFKLPPDSYTKYLAPPIFTDTLFHAAGFIANLAVRPDEVGICANIDSFEMVYDTIDYTEVFTIYCSLLEVQNALLADAVALDPRDNVVAVARGMKFKRLSLSTLKTSLARETVTPPKQVSPALQVKLQPPDTPPASNGNSGTTTPTKAGQAANVKLSFKTLIEEITGFSNRDLDYSKSLDELGIDSLMQIELAQKVNSAFPGEDVLDNLVFSQCEDLQSLETTLLSKLNAISNTEDLVTTTAKDDSYVEFGPTKNPSSGLPEKEKENPVRLHTTTTNATPLCLIHDGSGQINTYSRLRNCDRDVYAFFDPYFGSQNRPHRTLEQCAAHYMSLLSRSGLKRIILAGWSFGGILAFEIARQVSGQGIQVEGLILIDSPNPINHQPLPKEVIDKITSRNGEKVASNESSALRQEFQFCASLLRDYQPEQGKKSNTLPLKTVMLRSSDTLDIEKLCGVRYEWLSSQDSRDAAILVWEGLARGPIDVLSIPGNHFEAFTANNIEGTQSQLWKACRQLTSSVS